MVTLPKSWKVPYQLIVGAAAGLGAYFGGENVWGDGPMRVAGALIVVVGVAWLMGYLIKTTPV